MNSGPILKELIRFVDILYTEYKKKRHCEQLGRLYCRRKYFERRNQEFCFLRVEVEIYIRHPNGEVE